MTRNALLVASLVSAAVVTTAIVFPGLDAEPYPVREVAAVRHHDVTDAPRERPRERPEERPEARTMVASYYASSLAGNPTASGETYRPERYTAAHRRLPLGTKLKITYGGQSVRVVVNDRGPYVPGHDLDLSFAAAEDLGLVGPGVAPVRVTVL